MKMAKASQADLDLAMKITSALEAIERGLMPDAISEDDEAAEWFDIDDHKDCKRVLEHLLDESKKGSLARVTWGMFIICDEDNKILDPAVDHLALHPDLSDAGKMRQERDELLESLDWLIDRFGIFIASEMTDGDDQMAFDRAVQVRDKVRG